MRATTGTPPNGPLNPGHSVTLLLSRARAGDKTAHGQLWNLVYGNIRTIAANLMRKHAPGPSLQATALANEAVARMLPEPLGRFHTRRHLLAISATVMRRVLIDQSRRESNARLSLSDEHPDLDQIVLLFDEHPVDVLALEEVLERLAERDPDQARLVELRFYAGMTIEQAAKELGCSERTAVRQWRFVRSWLSKELR